MKVLERVEAEFPELSKIVRNILRDYPEYDKNVFLMMSFRETPELRQITSSIRYGLREYGLLGIRADDRAYSDDLWQNICGYMWACRYGVAVFEDIDNRCIIRL